MPRRKIRSAKGDFIGAPGALDEQIETHGLAKQRDEGRQKVKRTLPEDGPGFVDDKITKRILRDAGIQLRDENGGEENSQAKKDAELSKRMRLTSLGGRSEVGSEGDEDELNDQHQEDVVVEINPKEEEEFERFMVMNQPPGYRNLFDIIQAKIDEKKNFAESQMLIDTGYDIETRDLDEDVIKMYREVGKVMHKYRSGKVPKAFRFIPHMINWEQILYLTNPDEWSSGAMCQATKLFVVNQNPLVCQRFFNLVLLPRLRDDVAEFKKLNHHLYKALMTAVSKPAAFFKGIILPLCESGTCSLREAYLIGTSIKKSRIPILHSAAAILKIAEMEYNGANSLFLNTLLDKKYALPYRVIDAVCKHFGRFLEDERVLPVMWHNGVLTFVQRYKNDLSEQQRKDILKIVKKHFHFSITPEIRRELNSIANRVEGVEASGDVAMGNDAVRVLPAQPRQDNMHF